MDRHVAGATPACEPAPVESISPSRRARVSPHPETSPPPEQAEHGKTAQQERDGGGLRYSLNPGVDPYGVDDGPVEKIDQQVAATGNESPDENGKDPQGVGEAGVETERSTGAFDSWPLIVALSTRSHYQACRREMNAEMPVNLRVAVAPRIVRSDKGASRNLRTRS